RLSMLVILLNCVTLGMYDPCENIHCSSERCQILEAFDHFIFIFFAMEMLIKMIALGIFGSRSYLTDNWNRLDFFIVMAGVLEYSLDMQDVNLTAIRTVRVLRMRILVNLLLDTLPMLRNVLLLCFFVFFIFGIIGVQLWAGLLRNRCYPDDNLTLPTGVSLPSSYYMMDEYDDRPFVCSLPQDNGIMHCDDVPMRRLAGHQCLLTIEDLVQQQSSLNVTVLNSSAVEPDLCVNWNKYYTNCRTGEKNPFKGTVITLEGWVEIMYFVMNAHSFFSFVYFILLIIVGSYFMINLCLVVIATQFSETKKREYKLIQMQRAEQVSSSMPGSLTEPGSIFEELFHAISHILSMAKCHMVVLFHSLSRNIRKASDRTEKTSFQLQ
ncbi:hypothetical protein DNTS_023517, partial [Danionella cerebrum]